MTGKQYLMLVRWIMEADPAPAWVAEVLEGRGVPPRDHAY